MTMNKPVVLCAFADEASEQVTEQMRALKENGMAYLEARNVDGKNIADLTPGEARTLKERLAAEGLHVWSLGSPLGKIGIEENFAPHLDTFRRCLETAAITGAACIRLFSFFLPTGSDPAVYRDEVMERLSRFLEEAKGCPVVLCHENEKGIYGDTAARCLDIHRQLPALRAVFDPANFIQCGQETLEAWELLAPYVEYLHIKDALAGGQVVPAGKGDGHVPEILRRYRAQGGRVLTVEPHLVVFSGLDRLESGEKSVVDAYAYPSQRAAFDAAVAALRACLGEGGAEWKSARSCTRCESTPKPWRISAGRWKKSRPSGIGTCRCRAPAPTILPG